MIACEALLIVFTTVLLETISPDQPAGSTGHDQQCVQTAADAHAAFVRRDLMAKEPGQYRYRITAQVFQWKADGQHVWLFDLPATPQAPSADVPGRPTP